MIVEHSMVTTLGPAQAFDLVEGFLGAYDFTRLGQPGTIQRDFSRGKKNNAGAVYLKDIPQKIRIEYDRGRINFAASIDFRRKEDPNLRDFTVGLAKGLDRLLEDQLDPALAHAVVEAAAEKVARRDKRHKVVRVTLISLVIALFSIPFVLAIILGGR